MPFELGDPGEEAVRLDTFVTIPEKKLIEPFMEESPGPAVSESPGAS